MKKILRKGRKINKKAEVAIEEVERDMAKESRLAMIQSLIPLGLKAVEFELQEELLRVAGAPYSRGGTVKRWGHNPGSVFLGDQKVKLKVPRARDLDANEEVALSSYERLQSPQLVDDMGTGKGNQRNEPEKLREGLYACARDLWNKKDVIGQPGRAYCWRGGFSGLGEVELCYDERTAIHGLAELLI